jgi:hypothetical protein
MTNNSDITRLGKCRVSFRVSVSIYGGGMDAYSLCGRTGLSSRNYMPATDVRNGTWKVPDTRRRSCGVRPSWVAAVRAAIQGRATQR